MVCTSYSHDARQSVAAMAVLGRTAVSVGSRSTRVAVDPSTVGSVDSSTIGSPMTWELLAVASNGYHGGLIPRISMATR
jgi:hypothetical protein